MLDHNKVAYSDYTAKGKLLSLSTSQPFQSFWQLPFNFGFTYTNFEQCLHLQQGDPLGSVCFE